MNSELIAFIESEKKYAESCVKFREDSVKCWRGGTDESWKAVGCRKTKAQRLETAAIHGRIAIKMRRRVELFDGVLDVLLNSGRAMK